MNPLETEINGNHTIIEALEILMLKVNTMANSEEAAKFNKENLSWSNLFRTSYKPYHNALEQYEAALKINEWLNGKNPENGKLPLKEIFISLTDGEKLSLFNNRINSNTPSIFDGYLQAWWINRY